MGGNRQRAQQQQTQYSTQLSRQTSAGTPAALKILGDAEGLSGQVANMSSWAGDRMARPEVLDKYVAEWGQMPSKFVTQKSTTAAPSQVTGNFVAPNAEEGIAAGMQTGQAYHDAAQPLMSSGLQTIGQVIGNQQNPYMADVVANIQREHGEGAARARNAYLQDMGAAGSFGGVDMDRGLAWMAEQQQGELDSTLANLYYGDYQNWLDRVYQAPAAMAAYGAAGRMGADTLAEFGGMRQANLQQAEDVRRENAQIGEFNAWQQGQLADTNVERAAADELAKWNAQHQIDDAVIKNQVAQSEARTGQAQVDLDNNYMRWLAEQENTANKTQLMSQLMALTNMVPDTTTYTQGSGSGTGTQQQGSGNNSAAAAASIMSALIMAFASDKRVKTDIELIGQDNRGVNWYNYRYKWDPPGTKRQGVMAQELLAKAPQFVFNFMDDMLGVDYAGLTNWKGA